MTGMVAMDHWAVRLPLFKSLTLRVQVVTNGVIINAKNDNELDGYHMILSYIIYVYVCIVKQCNVMICYLMLC